MWKKQENVVKVKKSNNTLEAQNFVNFGCLTVNLEIEINRSAKPYGSKMCFIFLFLKINFKNALQIFMRLQN